MKPGDEDGNRGVSREKVGGAAGREGVSLVFVYNAESGVFNALADAAHKLLSPRTYACNLCALTYGAVRMRGEWKDFLSGLGAGLEFLHADELRARYGVAGVRLPAVFRRAGARLEVCLDAEAINRCRTLDDLKRRVSACI